MVTSNTLVDSCIIKRSIKMKSAFVWTASNAFALKKY